MSAALALAEARAALATSVHFPPEDGGRSLGEMAQSDLDAALQLLADRAQYITGASGAAIALRRDGRDDMLCRASVGSNAPELGTLLSTEFGLSGESVRTRQLLRCDDAERDARVNREVCRQLGIASVLVMPVVNDDQVLGVFELFSGKANAFGERDLSAVQRLSEMVETAVRLAQATASLPEQLSERENSVAQAVHPEVFEGQFLSDLVVEEVKELPVLTPHRKEHFGETIAAAALESPVAGAFQPAVKEDSDSEVQAARLPEAQSAPQPAANAHPVKKPLFWSAAAAGDGETVTIKEANQGHVPPVLRGLRKCEACGFPVSAGRVLCVECEEKKWRGQLRPQGQARTHAPVVSRPVGGSFAAAAPSMAKAVSLPENEINLGRSVRGPSEAEKSMDATAIPAALAGILESPGGRPDLVFSAAIEPSPSWLSSHKYTVLAVVVIVAAVTAFFLLR